MGEDRLREGEVAAGEAGFVAGDLDRGPANSLTRGGERWLRHLSTVRRLGTPSQTFPRKGDEGCRLVQDVGAPVPSVPDRDASNSANVIAVVPASSASWVRHEKPSASTIAAGCASTAGSRSCSATFTDTS